MMKNVVGGLLVAKVMLLGRFEVLLGQEWSCIVVRRFCKINEVSERMRGYRVVGLCRKYSRVFNRM